MEMKPEERAELERFRQDKANSKGELERFKKHKASGTFLDALASGSYFNDEFGGLVGGGMGMLPESMGGNDLGFVQNYTNTRDDIRGRSAAFNARNPMTGMLGEVVGAGALGGMGSANYLRAKVGEVGLSAYELARRTGLAGGVEGSIQALGSSKFDSQSPYDIAADVGKGGMLGGMGGIAGNAMIGSMRSGAGWLYDKLPFDRFEKSAPAKFAKKTMLEGGETQGDIISREARMNNPDATFTETADTGITMGQAVIGEQPGLIARAKNSIYDRLQGATDRVGGVIEDLTGNRPPVIAEIRNLARNRATDSNAEYNKFRAIVPEYDESMDALMSRPSMRKAWGLARELAAERGEVMPELFEEVDGVFQRVADQYPDFRAWDHMKSALWDLERTRMKTDGGHSKISAAIGKTRRELTSMLDDKYPDYKQARDTYRIPSQRMETIERGEDIFKTRTNDVVDELSTMNQSEKTDYMTGAWEAIQEKIGTPQEGFVSTYSWIKSKNNQAKLRALFPDGDEGDSNMQKLMQSIENEWRLRDSYNKIVNNSQTALRQSAIESLRGSGIGLNDMLSPVSAVSQAANKAMNRMRPEHVQELGQRLFKQGGTQDVLDWMNELAVPMAQRANMRGSMIRGVDMAQPYMRGSAGAMVHPLDRNR